MGPFAGRIIRTSHLLKIWNMHPANAGQRSRLVVAGDGVVAAALQGGGDKDRIRIKDYCVRMSQSVSETNRLGSKLFILKGWTFLFYGEQKTNGLQKRLAKHKKPQCNPVMDSAMMLFPLFHQVPCWNHRFRSSRNNQSPS